MTDAECLASMARNREKIEQWRLENVRRRQQREAEAAAKERNADFWHRVDARGTVLPMRRDWGTR